MMFMLGLVIVSICVEVAYGGVAGFAVLGAGLMIVGAVNTILEYLEFKREP
jgi:hypothetical protein